LIDGAAAQGMPVLQVFHTAPTGHFSLASGHVRTLEPVAIRPDAVFHKGRHSALVGTGLHLANAARHPPAPRVRRPHGAVLRDHDPPRL